MNKVFNASALDGRPGFEGFVRSDGRVGTRNYLGIFIASNCAATAARKIADWFTPKRLAAYPQVDGVLPFIHAMGCGMEKAGEPMDLLRRTLAGGIRNPNIAGAVVLALGCERNNLPVFLQQQGLQSGPMLHPIVLQDVGGTAAAIEAGIAAIQAMLPAADACARSPVSASHLVVGLQVDGDSAPLPAQQAIGVAVDQLVAAGATVIVSDAATMAADPAFVARAASQALRSALEQRVQWWRGYSGSHDTRSTRQRAAPASAPARAGLPITGGSALQAVVGYAHPAAAPGLVLMDSPRQEAVSATGQLASGATLACMLTANGGSFGAPGLPMLKVAADRAAYRDWEDDLDIDGGAASEGPQAAQELGQHIFRQLLEHASGRRTQAEEVGTASPAFAPWAIGVMT